MIDLIKNVKTRHVNSVSDDNVDELINRVVAPKEHFGVKDFVVGEHHLHQFLGTFRQFACRIESQTTALLLLEINVGRRLKISSLFLLLHAEQIWQPHRLFC